MSSVTTPAAFREHLKWLGAAYDQLESEHRALKSVLDDSGILGERRHEGLGGAHDAQSAREAVTQARVFSEEPLHGMAPSQPVVPTEAAPQLNGAASSPQLIVPADLAEPHIIGSPAGSRRHSFVSLLKDLSAERFGSKTAANPVTETSKMKKSVVLPDDEGHEGGGEHSSSAPALKRTNSFRGSTVSIREPFFADVEELKKDLREGLKTESYNVTKAYKTAGVCQRIARSSLFESITLVVIGLNALWIAIDTDYNKSELLINAHLAFQVAEHSFCLYFVAELLVRFGAFEYKRTCLRDMWFLFDASLVILMVLETWVMNLSILLTTGGGGSASGAELGNASVLRIARLLRLTRMARMARLLRAMPELVILAKGLVAAARSVMFTLILLSALLYVWAIGFTQLMRDTETGEAHFSSVLRSMHTLWLYATLLDEITHLMVEVEKTGIGNVLLVDAFILAAALTVMNMLVGVLCDVVSSVATAERQEMALAVVRSKVEIAFHQLGLDKDNNGLISKDEFRAIISNREAARAIHDLGVDIVQMVDLADSMFTSDYDEEEEKELTFGDFMDTVVQLRGSNFATVRDLERMRQSISKQMRFHRLKTCEDLHDLSDLSGISNVASRLPTLESIAPKLLLAGTSDSDLQSQSATSNDEEYAVLPGSPHPIREMFKHD